MAEFLIRTLHLMGVFGLAVIGIILVTAMRPALGKDAIFNICRAYLAAGAAALVTGLSGTGLWLWVGKPAAFYSQNPVFHAKLAAFLLVVTLSSGCAVFLYRLARRNLEPSPVHPSDLRRPEDKAAGHRIPVWILWAQRAGFALLLVIPVIAWLMARGIGY